MENITGDILRNCTTYPKFVLHDIQPLLKSNLRDDIWLNIYNNIGMNIAKNILIYNHNLNDNNINIRN